MIDLYTRLRADSSPLATEAADEISRLQREIYIRDSALEMFKDPEKLKKLQEIKKGLKL